MADSAITGNRSRSDTCSFEPPTDTHQAIDKLSAAYLSVQHLRRLLRPGDVLTEEQVEAIREIQTILADLGELLAHLHRPEQPAS